MIKNKPLAWMEWEHGSYFLSNNHQKKCLSLWPIALNIHGVHPVCKVCLRARFNIQKPKLCSSKLKFHTFRIWGDKLNKHRGRCRKILHFERKSVSFVFTKWNHICRQFTSKREATVGANKTLCWKFRSYPFKFNFIYVCTKSTIKRMVGIWKCLLQLCYCLFLSMSMAITSSVRLIVCMLSLLSGIISLTKRIKKKRNGKQTDRSALGGGMFLYFLRLTFIHNVFL